MDRGWWDEAVSIIPGRPGITLIVNSTAQARRVLEEEWPIDDGTKFRAAQAAVHSAKVSALKAQIAFKEAAEEAGILTDMPARPKRSVVLNSEGPTLWRSGRKRKLKRDM